MKRCHTLVLCFILAGLLSACDSSAPASPTPQPAAQAEPSAWIDAPLNESLLPLAPCEVVFHGNDPSGVTQIELSVNGEVLTSSFNPDPAQLLVTMRHTWQPSTPGNYTLRVRTQGASGAWGEYATVVVTVFGETETPVPPTPTSVVPTPTLAPPTPVPTLVPSPTLPPPTVTPISPTSVPTAVPTLPPPPPPQGPTLSEAYASPQVVYSDPNCGATHLNVRIFADDPSGVTDATLYYRLRDTSSGAETVWASVSLTRITWEPETAAHWVEQLDVRQDIVGAGLGHEYVFQYYFFSTNTLGLTGQSPTYGNVTLNTRFCVD